MEFHGFVYAYYTRKKAEWLFSASISVWNQDIRLAVQVFLQSFFCQTICAADLAGFQITRINGGDNIFFGNFQKTSSFSGVSSGLNGPRGSWLGLGLGLWVILAGNLPDIANTHACADASGQTSTARGVLGGVANRVGSLVACR